MLQITATEPPTAHRWRREGRLIRPWGTALRGHGRQTHKARQGRIGVDLHAVMAIDQHGEAGAAGPPLPRMSAFLASTAHERHQPMHHDYGKMTWSEVVTALAVLGLITWLFLR